MSKNPIEVEGRDELADLVASEDAVLLMFYTSGCGACKSMAPILGVLSKQTDVTIARCNPNTDISLVDEFDITSVPTLVLFVDGDEVARKAEGFVGADALRDALREHAPETVPADASA